MAQSSVNPYISGLRTKRQPSLDGQELLPSADNYGNQIVAPLHGKQHPLADEGSYFVARNPTPGTGIATAAAPTALSDTVSFLTLFNNAAASQVPSRRIYLDYLKLIVTAAGTAGTAVNLTLKIDNIQRFTSGGTAITPTNPNMDLTTASAAICNAGALTTTAASSAVRIVGHQQMRPVIPVVGDTYVFNFGGSAHAVGANIINGTAPATLVFPMAPVIIGPQHTAVWSLWLPTQSAASSYEIELGYWER